MKLLNLPFGPFSLHFIGINPNLTYIANLLSDSSLRFYRLIWNKDNMTTFCDILCLFNLFISNIYSSWLKVLHVLLAY